MRLALLTSVIVVLGGLLQSPTDSPRFASDLAFLRQHTKVVVLGRGTDGAQIVVAPDYQGRVLTSTTGGADAPSFGWLGRAAIGSGQRQPHMNVFGGEDRFWLGPEGGQFALYFKARDPFDFDHWQVPAAFDWGAWPVASQTATDIRFHTQMTLVNYSGTQMTIDVDRSVRLLSRSGDREQLGSAPGHGVRQVAFESSNTVTNAGTKRVESRSQGWFRSGFSGSSIRPRGRPSRYPLPTALNRPRSVRQRRVLRQGSAGPPDVKGSVVLLRADGQYRSKIGLPPARARSVAGSYDAAAHVLTIVQYSAPDGCDHATSTRCGKCRRSHTRETSSTATTTVRPPLVSRRSVRSTSSRHLRRH